MPTLTLDQIEAVAARHHADEAARNDSKPTAIRAIYMLADLSAADRDQVLTLLRDEITAAAGCDFVCQD